MGKSADSIAARQQVYRQLHDRFPKQSIEWVKTIRWDPADKVSLDDFDTQDETNWAAYKNPAHVEREVEQYENGENDPIIAIKPGDGPLIIVDGHHRYLARRKMGKSRAMTFVGHVPAGDGPWLYTHLSQKGGDSG